MGGYRLPFAGRPILREQSAIPELLMRQGDAAADAAHRSGAIWGGAVQQLGQIGGQAVQQVQMAKRDAAATAAIEGWDGKDPRMLLGSMMKIYGPQDGPRAAEAVLAFHSMSGQADERDFEGLLKMAPFVAGLSDPMLERFGPAIKQRVGGVLVKRFGLSPEQVEAMTPAEIREGAKSLLGPQKQPEGFTLSEGQTRFGPDGQPIANVPKPPPEVKPPDPRVVGRSLVSPDGKVIYRDPESPSQPPVDPLHQVDVNGVATWLPRSQAAGKPAAQAQRTVTGAERTALGFYNRAKQASEDITPIEEKIAGAGMASQIQLQNAPNFLQTETQQQYRQAQRAFTEARLRKESGAAIPDHEYANDARTYFAQPGDSPEVMAQKRAAREVVLQGLQYGAGKAYEEYYGEAPPTPRNQALRVNGPVDINAPPTVGKPKQIKNDADYDALPSGAEFVGPDGKRRRKP